MKTKQLAVMALISLWAMRSSAQNPLSIDLHEALRNKDIEVYNRKLTPLFEPSYMGIHLNRAEGEGIVWLKGIEFSTGILEFDVRGEDVKQHSFVGIAFHAKDSNTFDAIYLRPFQFKAREEVLIKRSIQYIALPDFPWQTLRERFPGQYEGAIEPAPDPNGWVRVRVVVTQSTVSTYINGNKEPSLVVRKVNQHNSGSIGFYVADTSGGDFANITITKTN